MDFFSRKVSILALFVLFLNLYFFKSFAGLGIALLLLTTSFVLLSALVNPDQFKRNRGLIAGFILAISIVGIISVFRANSTVSNIAALLGLNILLLAHYTISANSTISSSMELLSVGWRTFAQYLRTLSEIFSGKLKASDDQFNTQVVFANRTLKKTPWLSIVVGLFISIPVLTILLALLSSGDPIFGKTVQEFLNSPFIKELIPRLILSLAIFIGLLPFLYIKHKEAFKNPVSSLQGYNLIHEYSVVMALVGLTLAAFLLLQWQYVFIPSVEGINLTKFGFYTYSEYVTRGFNELLFASFFIYVLIWIGLIILRSPHQTKKQFLKILQIIVLSEFAFFIISIFRRVYLYQNYHGLTLIRAYGTFFLILLLSYTAVLLARHFWTKRWVLADIGLTLGVFVIFGFFNVEGEIATKNPPTVNNRVDFTYLSRLSADGYEGWKTAYKKVQEILTNPSLEEKVRVAQEVGAGADREHIPFSETERREVAYAGIALEQIMENHYELIYKYGSEEELKAYLSTILNYSIKRIELSINDPFLNISDNVSLPKNIVDEKNTIKTDLTAQKFKFEKMLAELNESKISPWQIRINFRSPATNATGYYQGKVVYRQDDCIIRAVCKSTLAYDRSSPPHGFFQINQDEEPVDRSPLVRLLTWNASEASAYENIKKDFSTDILLKLQEKFYDTFRQIGSVSIFGYKAGSPGDFDTEMQYFADIKLEAPFLKQLD